MSGFIRFLSCERDDRGSSDDRPDGGAAIVSPHGDPPGSRAWRGDASGGTAGHSPGAGVVPAILSGRLSESFYERYHRAGKSARTHLTGERLPHYSKEPHPRKEPS